MLQAVLSAALAAVVKALFGRWLTPKEKPDAALAATKDEAQAFAAPDRSKSRVIGVLRDHEQQ